MSAATRSTLVRFDANTANYSCSCAPEPYPGCMSSWNKLWGASRCGRLHPHHEDSDRFVWRRENATSEGELSIAAYAYDLSVKPYSPPNANLLQIFSTTLRPGVVYNLSMARSVGSTRYDLYSSAGALLESKTVLLKNHCADFADGYKLGLYYGGQCTAPQRVSACYANDSAAAAMGSAAGRAKSDDAGAEFALSQFSSTSAWPPCCRSSRRAWWDGPGQGQRLRAEPPALQRRRCADRRAGARGGFALRLIVKLITTLLSTFRLPTIANISLAATTLSLANGSLAVRTNISLAASVASNR